MQQGTTVAASGPERAVSGCWCQGNPSPPPLHAIEIVRWRIRQPVRAPNSQPKAPDCSLERVSPVRASHPQLAATNWLLEQVTHRNGPQTAGSWMLAGLGDSG
jgi:hypothetical protein